MFKGRQHHFPEEIWLLSKYLDYPEKSMSRIQKKTAPKSTPARTAIPVNFALTTGAGFAAKRKNQANNREHPFHTP